MKEELLNCDRCGKDRTDETDGHEWDTFDDEYNESLREYWLCDRCHEWGMENMALLE